MANAFIRNLAERGHHLHVAVSGSELKEPYGSNVTLHRIDTGKNTTGLLARVRFALGAHRTLKRLVRRGVVDIVHQLNPVVTGISLPCWNCSRPVVLGPYVPDWPLILYNGRLEPPRAIDRWKIRIKREIVQLQHRIASAIILSTPAALEKIRNRSGYKNKVHVIPYGVDVEAFSMSPMPVEKVILFVGSLMQHKGVFVLLEAFRQVLRIFPECRLVLAGIGSDAEKAKSVAASYDNPESVEFLGPIAHEDLPRVMRRGSIVCIPSFGEAFGLVALEAMACGRPVVGTEASGLAYLIADQGGHKVPVGDADKLAQSLIAILSDPVKARAMGEFNRSLAERQYAWPRVIHKLEEAYADALARYEGGKFSV
jgi:glycosyltransferase involved in cell wall biosynthesis